MVGIGLVGKGDNQMARVGSALGLSAGGHWQVVQGALLDTREMSYLDQLIAACR
jgi:hypothetical protein